MFNSLLDWIHSILDKSIPATAEIKWGNMLMMKSYDGWYDYLKDMFANMGWGTILLIAASALFWTAVYINIILRLYKDHAPSMPWICLCMNFSWEFQFAFLVPYPEPITRWGIYLWVVFDAVMYILDLKYGKMFFEKRFPGYGKLYYFLKVGLFAVIFVTILMMNPQWPTLPDSPMFAAYFMNAAMSMIFCAQIFLKETIEGLSIWVAWFKFLGTLAPTIIGIYWMPGQYFVYCLAFVCALFDIVYIYLLTVRFHECGINPYTRKPIKGKEEIAAKTFAAVEDYKARNAAFKFSTRAEILAAKEAANAEK